MLVFLLHSMKLLFTKPIPPNPAPSKIIPIISETLYIYLIGFHHDIYRLDLPESIYIKSGLGRGVKMKMKQSVCREVPLLLDS